MCGKNCFTAKVFEKLSNDLHVLEKDLEKKTNDLNCLDIIMEGLINEKNSLKSTVDELKVHTNKYIIKVMSYNLSKLRNFRTRSSNFYEKMGNLCRWIKAKI